MISHTKNFGIYHWDTFDNSFLIDEADTLDEAEEKIKKWINFFSNYLISKFPFFQVLRLAELKGRLDLYTDQVDIVDLDGDIVKKYSVS